MDTKQIDWTSKIKVNEIANDIYKTTGKPATVISEWSLSDVRPNKLSMPSTELRWENILKNDMSKVIAEYLAPKIKKVIYDIPNNTTIVYFEDGTKEIARVMDGDTFDKETGVMQCIVKKMYGSRSQWLKKIVDKGIEIKPKKK